MTDLLARPYREADAAAWDALVARSLNGTFLHTRRFLSYHGDRFVDRSLVFEDATGQPIGLLPAALDPAVPGCVTSHPGLSYGGLLHDGRLRGSAMIAAFEAACAHYRATGASEFRYKAIPFVYHRLPAADDLYALFRLGAERYRCDLSATIDLARQPPLSRQRAVNLRRARRNGLIIERDARHFPAFWAILTETLERRHGVGPVHSLAEIQALHALFPGQIQLVTAAAGPRVVAGTVIFQTTTADHAQYMSASLEGQELRALDLIFDHCFSAARARGQRYFDYGNSNEDDGRVLNDGLYAFKTGFGSGGVVREFFSQRLA